MDLRDLSRRLSDELAPRHTNPDDDPVGSAFFLAAAIHQVVDDYLHRDAFVLRKAAARFTVSPSRLASSAARLATFLAALSQAGRRCRRSERRLTRSADELVGVLVALADALVDGDETSHALGVARRLWAPRRAALEQAPARLLRRVARLPNTSYRLDQLPEDSCELVRRFTARWSDRARPILVVGIRTSGTYLAPLYVARLRDAGYRTVEMMSVRPHQHWFRFEARRLRASVEAGALLVIVDDPPSYGNVVAHVADELQRHGAPPESLVLSLPLMGPAESLPAPLRRYHASVLPWRDWEIHRRLQPSSVRRALEELLVGREIAGPQDQPVRVASVAGVSRVDSEDDRDHASARGHVYAAYSAVFTDADGGTFEQDIGVRGVGLGYFASHVAGVAAALADFVPEVYGVQDGLIYERRLQAAWAMDGSRLPGLEKRVASYIVARRERLAVDVDAAVRAVDQLAVWELVADILGRALAGPWKSFVFPLTHRASRQLLEVERPSVVDGAMATSTWFVPPSSGSERALKTGWGGGPLCYDAAFDLASAAASFDVEELLRGEDGVEDASSERLLNAYGNGSGEEVDPERLLLYQLLYNHDQLAHLSRRLATIQRRRRAGDEASEDDAAELARRRFATERALALAHQRYVAGIFFADIVPLADGPLCAIDIDWVLETSWFDFPAIAPAGALALRALMRHGYRPLLATARSLAEVRTRCRLYGLAGGVAEFGSVVYDHASGRAHAQLGRSQEQALDRLRDSLRRLPGVYLDDACRHGVRAVRINEQGSRRGLRDEQVEAALAEAGAAGSVQVLRGGGQTDFAPASLSKGTGLEALARELGIEPENGRPLAFAAGDDWPDVPMLALAEAAFAPANMSEGVRRSLPSSIKLKFARDPYGAGLLQAVTSFLGHDPRRCGTCALPSLSARQQMLLVALAGSDGPRRARLSNAARLAWLLWRPSGEAEPSPDLAVELARAAREAAYGHRGGREAARVSSKAKSGST